MKRNLGKPVGSCIFCDLPVYFTDRWQVLPLDRPVRIDLPVHKDCLKMHADETELKRFLSLNLQDYLEQNEEHNGKEKKQKRTKQAEY